MAGVVVMSMSMRTWRKPAPLHLRAIATRSSFWLTLAAPAAEPPPAPSSRIAPAPARGRR